MDYEPVLYNSIHTFTHEPRISFHMPVHNGGELYGADVADALLRLDVTELDATDNLAAPSGAILQAHENMARIFGADHAHLLVGGSSAGIHAMLFSCLKRGDTILVDRCAHQSVLNACVLYGFYPVFFEREVNQSFQIPGNLDLDSLRRAIAENPQAKAVLVTSPTYYGVCADVPALAKIVHNSGMALLVDSAHGSHFAFCSSLPQIPTAEGADLCVLSLHKTLGALTQTALLLHKSAAVPFAHVKTCLNLIQTTSPSYLFMCTADFLCAKMAAEGEFLFSRAVALAQNARQALAQTTRFICLPNEKGDLTRLVINVSAYAATGYVVAKRLETDFRIDIEMADQYNLVCIIGPLTTQRDVDALAAALAEIAAGLPLASNPPPNISPLPPLQLCEAPGDVFGGHTKTIPLDDSAGRICAATVSVYPPGVPCLIPGARITQQALQYIAAVQSCGGKVTGLQAGGIPVADK